MRPRVRRNSLQNGSGRMTATINRVTVTKGKTRVPHDGCIGFVLLEQNAGRVCWHFVDCAFFNPVISPVLRRCTDGTDFSPASLQAMYVSPRQSNARFPLYLHDEQFSCFPESTGQYL